MVTRDYQVVIFHDSPKGHGPPARAAHALLGNIVYNPNMLTLTDFELATIPGLLRRYDQAPRRLAFRARTPAEALAWQADLRAAFAQLLGEWPAERCALDPHLLERVEEVDFT